MTGQWGYGINVKLPSPCDLVIKWNNPLLTAICQSAKAVLMALSVGVRFYGGPEKVRREVCLPA